MKEEAAAELKDFLCINDHGIREQLLWIQWYHQWWFHSAIAYSSFVKADLAVKHIILSLQWWQSVPWLMNHLTVILRVCASDLLTIINPFMAKGKWHFTFVTLLFTDCTILFMEIELQWKTFLFVTTLREHATHLRPFMVKAENLLLYSTNDPFTESNHFPSVT